MNIHKGIQVLPGQFGLIWMDIVKEGFAKELFVFGRDGSLDGRGEVDEFEVAIGHQCPETMHWF